MDTSTVANFLTVEIYSESFQVNGYDKTQYTYFENILNIKDYVD